ncbi:enamine deaminase RidA (YjgF/YER057c/UK114 family) [Rhodoligotrophos appendicifer]|uniref:RidA family protein n=1 Tax=Rhodoligotrophos appendicifer TaxID=987056 RepID=UPI0011814535|nr:RidA family protein [Rhodoligotrophos appendicifer]
MQRRDINAPDAPAPAGRYSQAVEVTGATKTVYLSGQVGTDKEGMIPEDAAEQCRLVWANITAQLRAAGMTTDHIVKIVTILTDLSYLGANRTARQEALGECQPASTLIIAGLVDPALKVEIEVIAVS